MVFANIALILEIFLVSHVVEKSAIFLLVVSVDGSEQLLVPRC